MPLFHCVLVVLSAGNYPSEVEDSSIIPNIAVEKECVVLYHYSIICCEDILINEAQIKCGLQQFDLFLLEDFPTIAKSD